MELNRELGTLRPAFGANKGNPLPFVVGVQEPPTSTHSKIVGFERRHPLIYDRTAKRPRALLYHSAALNLWPVPEFTTEDMATGLWTREDAPGSRKEVYVTSIYMDITNPGVWPDRLVKLLNECQNRGREIILMADANAHSSLWGCCDTNSRGQKLEVLLLTYGLTVLNVGGDYTFSNARSRTIPDVTCCSGDIEKELSDWRVTDDISGSDHRLIKFNCRTHQPSTIWRRNFREGSWETFRRITSGRPPRYGNVWSSVLVEEALEDLQRKMTRALNITHPERAVTYRVKPFKWWSQELEALHQMQRRAYRRHLRCQTEESHSQFADARREFKKALRKAKREGRKQFTEDANDHKATSVFTKVIQGGDKHTLGLMKSASGMPLSSPTESLELLVNTHFPGNVEQLHTMESPIPALLCNTLNEKAEFINVTTVKDSIDSFHSYKAAGADGFPPCVLQHLGEEAIILLTKIFKACFLLGYTPKA